MSHNDSFEVGPDLSLSPSLPLGCWPCRSATRRSNTPWPASTLQPVCSPATTSTEVRTRPHTFIFKPWLSLLCHKKANCLLGNKGCVFRVCMCVHVFPSCLGKGEATSSRNTHDFWETQRGLLSLWPFTLLVELCLPSGEITSCFFFLTLCWTGVFSGWRLQNTACNCVTSSKNIVGYLTKIDAFAHNVWTIIITVFIKEKAHVAVFCSVRRRVKTGFQSSIQVISPVAVKHVAPAFRLLQVKLGC